MVEKTRFGFGLLASEDAASRVQVIGLVLAEHTKNNGREIYFISYDIDHVIVEELRGNFIILGGVGGV